MRISDWSSDVCSSDLVGATPPTHATFGMSEACLDRTQAVGGVAPTYGRYATVQAMPPLAPMTCPVTSLAAPEHRKRTTAATPTGVPGRPAGERTHVEGGKSVPTRVGRGGCRSIKKKE